MYSVTNSNGSYSTSITGPVVDKDKNKHNSKQEPEEQVFNSAEKGEDFDTINNEPVHNPGSQKINVQGDTSKLTEPMPGVNHPGATVNLDNPTNPEMEEPGNSKQAGQRSSSGGPSQSKQPDEPFNTEFTDMPKKEQEGSASEMATAAIYGYAQGKLMLGELTACISDRTVNKMHLEGKIDKMMKIRESRSSPNVKTIQQLFRDYNSQQLAPFQTSEDFYNNIHPPLTRILSKKGYAMTDEQLVLYYLGLDLVNTGRAAFGAMQSRKELIQNIQELCKMQPSGPVSADVPGGPAPVAQQNTPPPPPAPDPAK